MLEWLPLRFIFMKENLLGATMDNGLKLTCLHCGQVNRVPRERVEDRPRCGGCGAGLVDGDVPEIDLATLEKAARTDVLPLLVDFWASWCGPCRAMAPEFEKAARALKGRVRLAKVNTERHPDASVHFAIRGIPALIRFEKGREAARSAGARPAQGIVQFALEGLAQRA